MHIAILFIIALGLVGVVLFYLLDNSKKVNDVTQELISEKDFSDSTKDLIDNAKEAVGDLEDRKVENEQQINKTVTENKEIKDFLGGDK